MVVVNHRQLGDDSISVIRVRDVLMITMPSEPNDTTVAILQDRVLTAMERHRARGLVLDLSAVDTLDSFFARTVAETTRMVALMGGRTVIAGMRPSVAITAIQLGLTLGQALTALDVDRGLDLLNDPEHESW
jgi:rsbT antagonist protein RsbS